MKTKLFGRIGNRATLEGKMKEAEEAGAIVTEDKAAMTVHASFLGEQTLFKALYKGGGVWLTMYNPEFYPRN